MTINISEDGTVMSEEVIRVENPEDHEIFHYTREDNYLIMVSLLLQINLTHFSLNQMLSFDLKKLPNSQLLCITYFAIFFCILKYDQILKL